MTLRIILIVTKILSFAKLKMIENLKFCAMLWRGAKKYKQNEITYHGSKDAANIFLKFMSPALAKVEGRKKNK